MALTGRLHALPRALRRAQLAAYRDGHFAFAQDRQGSGLKFRSASKLSGPPFAKAQDSSQRERQ
jgi:hypothetical protein